MFETDEDVEEIEALDDEDLDEGSDADEDDALDDDDDDDESSPSLDELVAQRAAARRAVGELDDDGDIMALSSERDDDAVREPITPRVVPIKQRQEFVCNRCRLVKAKSQLADPQRGLCRDCV